MEINQRINELKNKLAQAISASQLPAWLVGLVLESIRGQVAQLEAQAVQAEAEEKENRPKGGKND